ncbi:hypothetical protein E4U38_005172 [Claviceps purpurea]|nr:hypothetical protein E4U38_005172 [Claviceps purpurea]
MPSTTTDITATGEALRWSKDHGDAHETGMQMHRAYQQAASPLKQPFEELEGARYITRAESCELVELRFGDRSKLRRGRRWHRHWRRRRQC